MTTAMRQRVGRHLVRALVALAVLIGTRSAFALTFDDRGEMRLGLRAYNAVRIGTETIGNSDNPLNYPVSGAGHLRRAASSSRSSTIQTSRALVPGAGVSLP